MNMSGFLSPQQHVISFLLMSMPFPLTGVKPLMINSHSIFYLDFISMASVGKFCIVLRYFFRTLSIVKFRMGFILVGSVNSEVTQGSVLGPLLFNYLIKISLNLFNPLFYSMHMTRSFPTFFYRPIPKFLYRPIH